MLKLKWTDWELNYAIENAVEQTGPGTKAKLAMLARLYEVVVEDAKRPGVLGENARSQLRDAGALEEEE